MRLTNRMITEFSNLAFGLHEQFELSFLCFISGAPGAHFLLNSEIIILKLPGEAIREVAVVDLEGRF